MGKRTPLPCPGDSVRVFRRGASAEHGERRRLGREGPRGDGGPVSSRACCRECGSAASRSGWGLSSCGQNPVLTNCSVIKTDFLCFKTLLVVCTDFPSFHKVENHEITRRGFEGNCP